MTERFDTIIAHARMVEAGDATRPVDIGITQGKIAALAPAGTLDNGAERIEADDKLVLPGAIDSHVHVRAPAFPERGTVESETRAAAMGGVTTIFEMPITDPCCNTPERVRSRTAHFGETALVDFAMFGAPADHAPEAIAAMVDAGVIAFKIFTTATPAGRDEEFLGLSHPNEAEQLSALRAIARTGRVVVVHPESQELVAHFERQAARMDPARAATHVASRPDVCEAVAIAKLLTLNIAAKAKLHFAHISSAMAVDVLRRFKGTSDFSAETCPHYLFRTVEDVERAGVFAKINPPVRGKADQDAIWSGLADGTITHVVTDHAAFSHAEKQARWGDFPNAPPGTPGLEILVPAMLDAAHNGRLSLEALQALLAGNAAARFGLAHKGRVAIGADADLILVDRADQTRISHETLQTKARDVAALYQGACFSGRVTTTLVRGEVVAQDGAIVGRPGFGRFLVPQADGQSGSTQPMETAP